MPDATLPKKVKKKKKLYKNFRLNQLFYKHLPLDCLQPFFIHK